MHHRAIFAAQQPSRSGVPKIHWACSKDGRIAQAEQEAAVGWQCAVEAQRLRIRPCALRNTWRVSFEQA